MLLKLEFFNSNPVYENLSDLKVRANDKMLTICTIMVVFHYKNRLKVSFFLNRNNLPIFGELKF